MLLGRNLFQQNHWKVSQACRQAQAPQVGDFPPIHRQHTEHTPRHTDRKQEFHNTDNGRTTTRSIRIFFYKPSFKMEQTEVKHKHEHILN